MTSLNIYCPFRCPRAVSKRTVLFFITSQILLVVFIYRNKTDYVNSKSVRQSFLWNLHRRVSDAAFLDIPSKIFENWPQTKEVKKSLLKTGFDVTEANTAKENREAGLEEDLKLEEAVGNNSLAEKLPKDSNSLNSHDFPNESNEKSESGNNYGKPKNEHQITSLDIESDKEKTLLAKKRLSSVEKRKSFPGNTGELKTSQTPRNNDENISFQSSNESGIFNNEQTFTLEDHGLNHFLKFENKLECYSEGTNLVQMQTQTEKCVCKLHYYGEDCGMPEVIWMGKYGRRKHKDALKRRKVPRRVINGLPLLNETTLLEARMHELEGAVDVYLLAESSYSAHGDPKKLFIKERLEKGFLREFHNKILHVLADFFPEKAKTDSTHADQYLRFYLGSQGIPRIKGFRDDDLFIMNDADEIPSREVVMFLKLYDGYTEPIELAYRWSVYGFFFKNLAKQTAVSMLLRKRKELTTTVPAVASMGLVTKVFQNNAYKIRSKLKLADKKFLRAYKKKHPGRYAIWAIGGVCHYAGWHCSWCFGPEGIVLKLDSAQAGDRPRWGDYPEKHKRDYLEGLIRDGRWFDGSSNTRLVTSPAEKMYAPPYLLQHARTFQSILFHPSQYDVSPSVSQYIQQVLDKSEP